MTENEKSDVLLEKSELIKPIDRKTVHRICSGQVVLSLAIAVKELIENAVDAGATKIDIRLKEYGSELVEVADNGCGVKKENFQALTLKHYTSKITEFTDLEGIETLGFRGEALSSLCALSDLSIITRHKSAECATKITYDHSGNVTNETPTAREEGMSVILSNLFSTLPVRKKEFTKNIKREFSKMCQLLYAYCLVCKKIRFSCTNQTSKNSTNNVVTTEGSSTIRENIISVFGTKQLSTLIDVQLTMPDESILKEYDLQLVPGEPLPFSFELIISSVTHGHGRSATDRQFYYINSRPCEPTKIMKLINEVYRQFNSHQYPFVYLNISMEKGQVDVNVTPDKRQVFVAKEKLLLATIKASLLEAFKAFPSTIKLQNVSITSSQNAESKKELNDSLRGLKRGPSEFKNGSISELFKKRSKTVATEEAIELRNRSITNLFEACPSTEQKSLSKPTNKIVNGRSTDLLKKCSKMEQEPVSPKTKNEESEQKTCKLRSKIEAVAVEEKTENKNIEILCETINNESQKIEVDDDLVNSVVLDKETEKEDEVSITLDISLEKIREVLKDTKTARENKEITVKFRSKITPDSNDIAQKELQKQISKEMFKQMSIIGQFNHGFIITKLKSDLFIVDQHATDEKYNFEHLQATTVLEHQVLVNPKPLELTAANESILIENEEIFKKNGFTFKIDHNAECTRKVCLTGIPISKNYIFGKDDIDEMLFMLQDASSAMCRPSRVRSMFASRACRKSVMVGDPLSQSDMRRLVDHMGEIEQPWNCPHGRPTIRHLINLDLISNN